MLTEQNVPEHYNPNTNNLYDGQHNIPLYKKSIFHQKKIPKNNFELLKKIRKKNIFLKTKLFRIVFGDRTFFGPHLKWTKINHSIPAIACRESQFPKFAVYENTKNHVEITRHKNLSFCSKILVFARPWNSTNQRLSHFWWSRETLIQVKYCTACHFHGKQFYWTKGWKNLIGWERKRWIRWNCQMIIRWYENEPIRK